MAEQETKKTEWNMAMAYYMRISALLDIATQQALEERGRDWYKTLLRILTEVRPKMSDNEKDEMAGLLPNLAIEIKKLPIGRSMSPELYGKMNGFEDRLRELMEKHDMLIPNKEDVTKF